MYRVEVRWAPAHELIVSLSSYTERKGHKLLDLGSKWAAKVRKQLSPELAARLEEPLPLHTGPLLHVLADQHPGDGEVETFLVWLSAMPAAEFYDRVAPCLSDGGPALPADLPRYIHETADLLSQWYSQYFRTIDPSILPALAAEANAQRQAAERQSPQEAVESATNGIVLEAEPDLALIRLIPTYHHHPLNRYIRLKESGMFLYGVDGPVAPGEPPPRLLRTLRALTDESRIRMLRFIAHESRTFTEIARQSGLALSTVHHHLITLRAAGLVRVHDLGPGAGPGQYTARYSFRPAAVSELGPRLTDMIMGG